MTLKVTCKFQFSLILFLSLFLFTSTYSLAQRHKFTRADSLRGHLNIFRSCFDVTYYDLFVQVDIDKKSIKGSNYIQMLATRDFIRIQLDLFSNMEIDSIIYDRKSLPYEREANAFYVQFPDTIKTDQLLGIHVYYHGTPIVAKRPPWDGGFVWAKDSLGRDWVGVTCEGMGASLWWPNKDHLSDRPDSMRISMEIPDNLKGVSNGRLLDTISLANGNKIWTWKVSYPINNYNVSLNIAHYSYFHDQFQGLEGLLDLNYWVLDYNLDKAKEQFRQVPPMILCYEHYFGPYPFMRDGYKLVETSYWGMEHQSCIAYGNNYENNDFGFDYIIIHESAHEYWGNSVSAKDHGEVWIHESFATYMESLFMEFYHGRKAAADYMELQKESIENRNPILGPLEVNYINWNDADMYYKGSWMLHSIRNTINNDPEWFTLLKNMYQEFKYTTVTSKEIIGYLNARTEYNLEPIFSNFLENDKAPLLKAATRRNKAGIALKYKWKNVLEDFNMPVEIRYGQENYRLFPTKKKHLLTLPNLKDEKITYSTELFYFFVKE